MLVLTSPTVVYVHGACTPSQFAGVGGPPAKWSFSSDVTTNSVLRVEIPSRPSRSKKDANALSYDFSAAT